MIRIRPFFTLTAVFGWLFAGAVHAIPVTYNYSSSSGSGSITWDVDPSWLTTNGTEIDSTPEAGDLSSSLVSFSFTIGGITFALPSFEMRDYRFVSDETGRLFQGSLTIRQVSPVGPPLLSLRANGNWSIAFGGGVTDSGTGRWTLAAVGVPEPGSAALLFIGLALMGVAQWSRSRRILLADRRSLHGLSTG